MSQESVIPRQSIIVSRNKMQLKNPFSEKTRNLFRDNEICFVCLLGGADALHHICGRSSDSPMNACPVHNFGCHIGRDGELGRMKTKLLNRTLQYLKNSGYVPNEDDRQFVIKNSKHFRLYESDWAYLGICHIK